MYTAFYGLREKPFALSPDPRFLFLAQSHREALAHLLYGVEQGEGFIAITGEVGTGKTTLCRTLLQRLGAESEVAFVFNPKLSALDLLRTINSEFGLPCQSDSQRELNDALNRFLLQKKRDGKRVLLIIDEAQNLEQETLEQVRLLSNLETESSKLIQIVLIGQPELDAMLESPELRQLKQRIGVRWRLRPLSPSETRDYVRHRMRVAARGARELFSAPALRELHRLSGGVPRVVNVLADRALLAGYAGGAREIAPSLVRQAASEVRGEGKGGWIARRLTRSPMLDVSVALTVVLCVGIWFWLSSGSQRTEPVAGGAPPDVAAPPPATPAAASPHLDTGPVGAAPEATLSPQAAEGAATLAAYSPGSSPAASGVPAVPDPVLPPLGKLLANEALDANAANALAALLAVWGLGPETTPPQTLDDLLAALERRRLSIVDVSGGDLASLRSLNHPALLQIKAADGVPRLIVLRELDAWHATLDGVGPTGSVQVSAAELAALWNGEAWVAWRDFESLPEFLQPGVSGRSLLWLQESLASLGFYRGPITGRFDDETQEAVRAFQRSRELTADGMVGPMTKMALYDSLSRYAVPRLHAGRDVG